MNNQMKSLQTAVGAMKEMNRGVMETGCGRSPFREGYSRRGSGVYERVMGKTGEGEPQAEGIARAKA